MPVPSAGRRTGEGYRGASAVKVFTVAAVFLLVLSGCGGEYVDEGRRIQALDEAEHPEIAEARDILAAALRFDIDRFVERNDPRVKVCFLSILNYDPADELLARLKGTRLEVHKFSEWSRYIKNDKGQSVMPGRYLIVSVRDFRVIDSSHAEVETVWNDSGIAIPGETFRVEKIAGKWVVMSAAYTPA